MRVFDRLLWGLESITGILSSVAAVTLCAMFLLIVLDVTGRGVFNLPVSGTIEISEYLVVVIAMLPWGYAQLRGRHVRMESAVARLSPRTQSVLRIFWIVLSIAFFALFSWQLAQVTYAAWASKATHWAAAFPLPTWPPNLAALLGSVSLAIVLFAQLLREISGFVAGDASWTP